MYNPNDERRKAERRKKERRGSVPVWRPVMLPHELPEQVAKARAVSGGASRRQKLEISVNLSRPTPVYKASSVASFVKQEHSKKFELSPFEATFPGWKEWFMVVGRMIRQKWGLMWRG